LLVVAGIAADPSAIGLSEGGRFRRSPATAGRGRKIPAPATDKKMARIAAV